MLFFTFIHPLFAHSRWRYVQQNEADHPSQCRPPDVHQLRLVGEHGQAQHDLCRRRVAVSCNVSLLKWKIKKKKEKKSVGRGIAYLVPGDIKASNELLFLSS